MNTSEQTLSESPVDSPNSSATQQPADTANQDGASAYLPQIEQGLENALAFGPGCPPQFADAIRYSLLSPGKRLRPRLVLMAAEACGGDPAKAMPAACAVELIHAYSLVHDDLPAMDDDDLRRGRPTTHVKFGEATAILVGDALQARAFEILATEIEPAELAGRCCGELARAAGAEHLVGGQVDDLVGLFDGATASDLKQIHARKTGAMFEVSLRLGAIIAGATNVQIEAISIYARALGLLFQVTDDLLDIGGEEQKVGKRLGKDARRGKMTYPALLGVEETRIFASELADQARKVTGLLGEPGKPLADLATKVLHRDH